MKKRYLTVGVLAAAAFAPAAAAGRGGVAACAADHGGTPRDYAPVTSPLVTQDDTPPPGPMAGPHSVHDWGDARNNGGDLTGFCDLGPNR
jgi:hypothetical protein